MAIENSEFPLPSSLVFTPPSNAGNGKHPSILGEIEASSAHAVSTPITLALRDAPYERHDKQLLKNAPHLIPIGTPEFPAETLGEEIAISDRYRRVKLTASADGKELPIGGFTAFDDSLLIQKSLYLFNVIVALEWLPSHSTIQQLMSAFRSASDFLYDCTNGFMAFGQVIFADRELLDNADIQIMASNRFHPRSLVNALNEPDKFSPIRLGRGLWSKNNSVLIPWSEPIAFRTIIHEWGHYALSLHDEYIDEAKLVKLGHGNNSLVDAKDEDEAEKILVVPSYSVSLESIMATLDSSEIVPKQRKTIAGDPARSHLLNKFEGLYPGVSAALTGPANAGPNRLPLTLPQFYSTSDTTANGKPCEERLIDINNLKISKQPPQHCWLYLLHRNSSNYELERIVAQGAIDARARDLQFNEGIIKGQGFELLGDTTCDEVLAIGYSQLNGTGNSALFIRGASLSKIPLTRMASTPSQDLPAVDWNANIGPLQLPVVTVIPNPQSLPFPTVVVKVRVVGGEQPADVWIIPTGQVKPTRLKPAQTVPYWESEFVELQQLDGLVVLQYGQGDSVAFWVCEYSHGGNPPTSVRKQPAPVSAGSSDGNLMLFCRTEDEATQFASKRVVTTRNYATFGTGKDKQPAFYQFDAAKEVYTLSGRLPGTPASYLFSVASNSDLPTATLLPTIIMYFDINSLNDEGDPIIHRYNIQGCRWEPLPTYSPRGSYYAAIPLDQQSGPDLVAPESTESRVEYYQLFLVKSGDSKP